MAEDVAIVPESHHESDTFDPTSVDWEAVASVAGASEIEPDDLEGLPAWDPRVTPISEEEDAAFMEHRYPNPDMDGTDGSFDSYAV